MSAVLGEGLIIMDTGSGEGDAASERAPKLIREDGAELDGCDGEREGEGVRKTISSSTNPISTSIVSDISGR